ncbi:MAG TPA: sigma-54-dependent Fis family transcriptional regulator, partial [Thermosulfidibacter takaii]|nr:sigma-54-dependent Fis family transcriptional regulator [Thermosulfidibacter takaii]
MDKENFRILVVDDDKAFLLLLTSILKDAGYRVDRASSGEEALKKLRRFSPHLIIADLKMPGISGLELTEKVKEEHPEMEVVMITAYGTVDTAVRAMKLGAFDYITKPLKDPEELRQLVARVFEKQQLKLENQLLREQLSQDLPPMDLIFLGMEDLRQEVEEVAPTDATVMLYGESGTGKSLIAKVIHHLSGRKGPFVEINCAAIPENLLEAELFGYERGAFTGATSTKKGKFELAQRGTIFLDEISEMGPSSQAKLLRVLQDGSFERLGGLATIKTDARVIAATNRNLKEALKEKIFREDLYYRLNVFPIEIPPLRKRREAIPQLVRYLTATMSKRLGKEITEIPKKVMDTLVKYPWPGNIRELQNVIERAVILSKGGRLAPPRLEEEREEDFLEGSLKELEKKAIERALEKFGGNRKKAAEYLGISLRT